MNARAQQAGDFAAIERMHAEMGLDYKMPDLDGELISVVEEGDEIIAAVALKLQPETYLWVRPALTPAQKWDAIRLMQRELVKMAMRYGFEQLVAYVPPCISRFSKRLTMLRWEKPRDGWQTWIYEVRR